MSARRVAVVDVGSNSTRLLVADVRDGAVIAEVDRRSRVTRLADGVDATGTLSRAALDRVSAVLTEYRDAIDAAGARRATAVLTSAVRDAANGPAFQADLAERFALDAHVLTGDEEARLTWLGATAGRAIDAPTLVVDVGGGSTELVVGTAGGVDTSASTQVGVVRHSERHLHDDPPTARQLAALRADVRVTFARHARPVGHAVAVAGTATTLAAIDLALEPYDPARVEGRMLTVAHCEAELARLAAMTPAQRRALPGLHPDRATVIVAGTAILIEALRAHGADRVEVSDHDILRGAAVALS